MPSAATDPREGDADVTMADALPGEPPATEMDEEEEEAAPMRLRVLPGSTETAASFEFAKEDHTLGNALRWIIMKNPVVEFCGYTIPHPSEARMNLRIQTYDNASVYDVLDKGLVDLMDLCDVVQEKFEIVRDDFKKK
ncbi:RBP11-like subunits of RNA polymerase [Pseudovirgaria hyperparasitica]|uniref:DNA-directed RNA polymerases I and III subunit RPAC2 n=1 Tax=Pseudovirgaria hyperparasitica TaxID=470096 RepID=A0A6A6W1H1_9PEZI|nr:RBP11-like subunits of RNA polymerase [Pseudovirgaria hyperparasitica]KAF2755834.1 RBP11-like subunits of RNA polymerase [Pseudovirgaria hyperparasitica]